MFSTASAHFASIISSQFNCVCFYAGFYCKTQQEGGEEREFMFNRPEYRDVVIMLGLKTEVLARRLSLVIKPSLGGENSL